MATQLEVISDIIDNLRKKHDRENNSSDSDDDIVQSTDRTATNRGNKLRRHARYLQESKLAATDSLAGYPQTILHAGYTKRILYRNPPRIDEDGVELGDSDIDEYADAVAAEENPYSDVKIERVLEPLMRASDLPVNPSYSYAYTSPALTDMVSNAERSLQEARAALWKAKNLLTQFRGDEMWMPCAAVELDDDSEIFLPRRSNLSHAKPLKDKSRPSANGSKESLISVRVTEIHKSGDSTLQIDGAVDEIIPNGQPASEDVEMVDAPISVTDASKATNGEDSNDKAIQNNVGDAASMDEMEGLATKKEIGQDAHGTEVNGSDAKTDINGRTDQNNNPPIKKPANGVDTAEFEEPAPKGSQLDQDEDGTPPPPPRRMTTRAQAQAATTSLENSNSTRSQSPATSTISSNYIAPLYLLPSLAMPDRDFGLPPNEADETRRLLMTYIQKQEEVVRGYEKLFEKLSRAERYRKMVLEWCKADGHTGEMSDGEDWYDKEYWGLEEDLKKGHDDEEEGEAAGVNDKGKRSRGRRA